MRKPTRLDARSAIRCAVAEVLEPRRLFAAIESGILVARGTANADSFSVRRSGTDDVIVTTNGVNQTFDMDNFTGVRLEGLGGNDTFNLIDPLISPVVRDTRVLGGAGNDTISYATRTDSIIFQVDTTGATAERGRQLDTFDEVETVVGGADGDSFSYGDIFDSPNDPETEPFVFRLEGGGGDDSFFDALDGHENFGSIAVVGGEGNDHFTNREHGLETFSGGAGNDIFVNRENAYSQGRIDGGDDVDEIEFRGRESGVYDLNDFSNIENATLVVVGTLIGTDGPNVLRSVGGTVHGGGGNDTLVGIGGAVTLLGEGGDDSLQGDTANDSLLGGPGNDTLNGGNGTDFGDGGAGTNTLISIENGPGTGDPTSPAIAITGGVLVANGTGGVDTFTVRRTGTDNVIVTVNALSREFDMDDFTGVRLVGFGGNDTFNLIDPLISPVVRNTTVFGGAGNDTVSYATRTAAITAFGYMEPDAAMDVPFIRVTSGAQVDRLDNTVETVIGGSGNDSLGAQDFGNAIGRDFPLPSLLRFEGRGGNDRFGSPTELAAVQDGGAGNDTFEVDESASENIIGGDGDDTIVYDNFGQAESVDAGPGHDTLVGSTLRPTIDASGFAGLEDIIDVSSDVTLVIGNSLNNLITTQEETNENLTIRGGAGNDTIQGGSSGELLQGEEGNDSLIGGPGDDTLDGGSGTDFADGDGGSNTHISIEQFAGGTASIAIVNRVLTATGTSNGETITIERSLSDDVIVKVGSVSRSFDMDDFDTVLLQGLGGNDTITILAPITAGALTRKVTLDGGAGNDSLTGNSGDDVLRGGDGIDTLVGLGGRDALSGNAGNDQLFGGSGLDFLDGGDNDDFIDSSDGVGGDTVLGGNGTADSARVDAGDSTSGVESFV